MVYTRILDWRCCVTSVDLPAPGVEFDPSKILDELPKEWTRSTGGIIIMLSDGDTTVEYMFEKLLARSYVVSGHMVKFGMKWLDLNKLTITTGVKFVLRDLSGIYSPDVD